MKRLLSFRLLAAVFAVVFLAAGCISYESSRPPVHQTEPTLGQELIDLQDARDRGALTDVEYDRARQGLLNGN
jgi:hypothetical protein